jgi:hypothetical protein
VGTAESGAATVKGIESGLTCQSTGLVLAGFARWREPVIDNVHPALNAWHRALHLTGFSLLLPDAAV